MRLPLETCHLERMPLAFEGSSAASRKVGALNPLQRFDLFAQAGQHPLAPIWLWNGSNPAPMIEITG
jgi:hypothetical protein